jgi:hemoglobin/transferrin/lactoferrin receptor protein
MRWQGDRSRLQVGAFHTRYKDFIETKVRVGTDPVSGRLLFQSINIGDATIRGVEARWARELGGALQGLTLSASAYWAEGDNRDNEQPLNSVGPAEAVIGTTWRSDDEQTEIRALLTATTGWSRRDTTAGDLFEPAGHAVLDVFLVHAISERLTFRAGVGNATDRVYWQWSEVRGLAPDDALLPTLAEAGRNFSIGLDWDW